ncbi:hypothetical protein QVD17_30428 [Tagetes erecta]|uniref:PB1-like domain-containing protein n=1 Tax=Tagetes erecta TaxID=13708 RepID=A0AAD8NNE7_TARER|nr:hypothetical protein QVD17_30428 [Tagetes erecta]
MYNFLNAWDDVLRHVHVADTDMENKSKKTTLLLQEMKKKTLKKKTKLILYNNQNDLQQWTIMVVEIRSVNKYESWLIVQDVYTNNPTEFSLKIYHYGHFSSTPGRTYDDGVITFVDYLEANQFKFSDMSLIIPQLGYGNTNNMWFYFKIHGGDLDTGLVPVRNDEDVSRLVSYTGVEGVKEISLYVVRCEVDANTGKGLMRKARMPPKEGYSSKRRLFS